MTAWLATDGRNSYGHTAVVDRGKRPIVKRLSTGDELGIVIAGYAVTARMVQRWEPAEVPEEACADDVLAELAEDFGQFVMEDDTRWRRVVQEDDPGAHGSALIFGLGGVVASVDARFGITLDQANRAAEGCGGDVALAVAVAAHDAGMDWPGALVHGLSYAAQFDVHVGEPFTVVALGLHPGGIPEQRQDDR